MESSIRTSGPLAEASKKINDWYAIQLENEKGWEFLSPSDYLFSFETVEDIIDFGSKLTKNGIIGISGIGEMYFVEGDKLKVFYADPWVNKDYEYDDQICYVSEFLAVILNFLGLKWKK